MARDKNKNDEAENQGADAQAAVPEGTPPVIAEEGGVVKEGTGDYAPEGGDKNADEAEGVKLEDGYGNVVTVPVGRDGKNPVSPDNPHPKASIGTEDTARAQADNESAKGRSEGADGDRLSFKQEDVDKSRAAAAKGEAVKK